MARMSSAQSPLFLGGATARAPETRTAAHGVGRGSRVSNKRKRTRNVRKEIQPELAWVIAQIAISPLLKDSPRDLMSAFAAHIAWVSDFGNGALYRAHNNLAGIPYDKTTVARFGGTLGFPDAYGRIARFPDLFNFVEAYLHMHEHLLKLSAGEFFAHMRKNDLRPNAARRWDKIVETWEKQFAQRLGTI